MEIVLLVVGATRDVHMSAMIADYAARLSHYFPFSIEVVSDLAHKMRNPEEQKVAEGLALLKKLKASDRPLLLDVEGVELDSPSLAARLQKVAASGAKRWAWLVGGPYGFSQEVYCRVPERLSLSKLTLTHEMARLIATEQLYRAATILRGEPYHHA